jgi:hypothetical protein
VPRSQAADSLSAAHLLADGDRGRDGLIGGSQTARVFHGNHVTIGERTREAHEAGLRGQDGLPGGADKIDTAMPGTVGVGWRLKRARYLVGVEGPLECRRLVLGGGFLTACL